MSYCPPSLVHCFSTEPHFSGLSQKASRSRDNSPAGGSRGSFLRPVECRRVSALICGPQKVSAAYKHIVETQMVYQVTCLLWKPFVGYLVSYVHAQGNARRQDVKTITDSQHAPAPSQLRMASCSPGVNQKFFLSPARVRERIKCSESPIAPFWAWSAVCSEDTLASGTRLLRF